MTPTQLHIYTGNHIETLARRLSQNLRQSDASAERDPLRPEVDMVQSHGMQRWVSMNIARHNQICANMEFPFPNAFLEANYGHAFGDLPEHSPFAPHHLTFRILRLLRLSMAEQPFESIGNYLAGDERQLKAYQLSKKLADIFDQYLVFRPELLKQWEKGEGLQQSANHLWQGLLWRRLMAESAVPHRAELQHALVKRLLDTHEPIDSLPDRISVFGISYLPPFHLRVMQALALRIPVHLYLLNPCREYWADIISQRRLNKVRLQASQTHTDPSDLHFERGNQLLSSWGEQGRHFFSLIQQLEAPVEELFADNRGNTLLSRLQQDILDLEDRPRPHHDPSHVQDVADASLRINVCHSPMREVEVLQDQLLDMLASDPQLHPGDVLVMAPDIAAYAPYIHGVFGTGGEKQERSIPYTVADQSLPQESPLVEGFLRLLHLRNSRFEATRVLDLLEYQPIRARFGLRATDLSLVEQWVDESSIRWRWSGTDRKKYGLPRFRQNTWRAGLDRLLMGYGVMLDEDTLCSGILPHEGIEGSQGDILGRLTRFAEQLHFRLSQIPQRAPLERWPDILSDLMDAFLVNSEQWGHDRQLMRNAMEKIKRIACDPSACGTVSFDVVLTCLADMLNGFSFGTGFMSGSVTFCSMLPMRSIPAKVICIMGMQHDAFPQDFHQPEFNLIAADPRQGDRSKRNDDKYLFLEALLSARRCFYISYIGQDIQDNSPIPPSVLVSELLEYCTEGLDIPYERLVTHHPLQAFAPAYFDGSNQHLYSYSREDLEACRQLARGRVVRPFFDASLPPPGDEWRNIDIASLCAFFAHPIKYLLEQRMGIFLNRTHAVTQDKENFNPDALDRFFIGQTILHSSAKGIEPDESHAIASAAGRLPHGTVGNVVHDQIRAEVESFNTALDRQLPARPPESVAQNIERDRFKINGRIDNLYPHARIVYRMAKIRPKDKLSLFIQHLAMLAAPAFELPKVSIMIGKDLIIKLGPVKDPGSVLDEYLARYWEGMQRPLCFFPLTSYVYALQRIEREAEPRRAMRQALKSWQGGYYQDGEVLDPYINLCKETAHPLDPTFEPLALQIYTPLIRNLEILDV